MSSATPAASACESESATESNTVSNKSNWRVLRKNDTDKATSSLLSLRAPWSEHQYQDSLDLYHRLMECTDSYVAPGINQALNCLDHAYRLYGPESVLCSFNGGKDAVVILHLLRAAHAHYYHDCRQQRTEDQNHGNDAAASSRHEPIIRPRTVYFEHKDEFPQVLQFLHETVEEYDLDMVAFEQGVSFSDGLSVLVKHNLAPGVSQIVSSTTTNTTNTRPFPMAFCLGTRSSDPNAHSQGHFAPSSHYMPPFMRVNPILEWTYGHVWHFLRLWSLPYCCLYDMGYTSLGTIKDTRPCPALAVAGVGTERGSVIPRFWPAYMLRDWDQERAGRIKKEQQQQPTTLKRKMVERTPTRGADASSSVGGGDDQYSTLSNAVASTIVDGTAVADPIGASTIMNTTTVGNHNVPPTSERETNLSYDVAASPAMSFSCNENKQRTVGLLIIGNEILKGQTADTNTLTAAKALWNNTVLLSRVVVVSDDQEEIAAEIQRMQSEVDVIITSGGVGPTHDDVTIKSVAAALDRKMVFNDNMAQLLREKMNTRQDVQLTEAQRKMATLPANCTLRYLSDIETDWPVLQCRNIFVLPGVPEYFAKKIECLALYLSTQLERSATYKLVLSVDEASIVDALNAAVERHPNVTFGSYPFVSHPEFKTVVTLEGRMVKNSERGDISFDGGYDGWEQTSHSLFSKEQTDFHVREALDELIDTLPKGSILRVDNNDGMLFL